MRRDLGRAALIAFMLLLLDPPSSCHGEKISRGKANAGRTLLQRPTTLGQLDSGSSNSGTPPPPPSSTGEPPPPSRLTGNFPPPLGLTSSPPPPASLAPPPAPSTQQAALTAQPSGATGGVGGGGACGTVQLNSNAAGEVLQIGNKTASLQACCAACKSAGRCNVYNWCPEANGCDNGHGIIYPPNLCTLKRQQQVAQGQDPEFYSRGAGVTWTSGWFPNT